ncbi:MAG: phosphonate ABC transporter ATP-binding protein [Spirochaetales bacterium]|nr:phosphonate ABC transporter ATP-binding protein [Spirochaetales bacterium]
MIQINNISKCFGNLNAVDDVSLIIPDGQMVGIIGSSGAGKSTLLRLINRLWDPTQGQIFYKGKEITQFKGRELLRWRTKAAMIFQQFNLVKRLNVFTNVLMGRLGYHKTLPSLFMMFTKEERALAIEKLDRVEITDQALKRCDQLSGGQQQRVAIARAMMQNPEIILADEPIASLDPRSAAKVMETLRDINRKEGITVIASLHHLASARMYCERIIGMANGKIVFDGKPSELTKEEVLKIYRVEDAEEELEHDIENVEMLKHQKQGRKVAVPG